MAHRPSILVICTGNAARSQMAEALLKHICEDRYDIYSAGTHPWTVRPGAIEAMAELGIDISQNRSKSVNEFIEHNIDFVLTVCDDARAECANFPARKRLIHHSIPDPVYAVGDSAARLEAFRSARDEIRSFLVDEFLPEIEKEAAG
jgi:arsenate reductase